MYVVLTDVGEKSYFEIGKQIEKCNLQATLLKMKRL